MNCLNLNDPEIQRIVKDFGEVTTSRLIEENFPNMDNFSYEAFFRNRTVRSALGIQPKNITRTFPAKRSYPPRVSQAQLMRLRRDISEMNNRNRALGINEIYKDYGVTKIGEADLYTWGIRKITGKLDVEAKLQRQVSRYNNTPAQRRKEAALRRMQEAEERSNIEERTETEEKTSDEREDTTNESGLQEGDQYTLFSPPLNLIGKLTDRFLRFESDDTVQSEVSTQDSSRVQGITRSQDISIDLPADPQQKLLDDKDLGYFRNTLDSLSNKFGIPYEIISDPNNPHKGYIDTESYETPRVIINVDKAAHDTPFYEYGQIFLNMIRSGNKRLYSNIVNEILETEHGKETLENFKNLYPEYTLERQVEESLSFLLGKFAKEEVDPKTGLHKAIKRLWDSILEFLSNAFNVEIKDIYYRTSIEELAKILSHPNINLNQKTPGDSAFKVSSDQARRNLERLRRMRDTFESLEDPNLITIHVIDTYSGSVSHRDLYFYANQEEYNNFEREVESFIEDSYRYIDNEAFDDVKNFLQNNSLRESVGDLDFSEYPNLNRILKFIFTGNPRVALYELENHIKTDDREGFKKAFDRYRNDSIGSIIEQIFSGYTIKTIVEAVDITIPKHLVVPHYLMDDNVEDFRSELDSRIEIASHAADNPTLDRRYLSRSAEFETSEGTYRVSGRLQDSNININFSSRAHGMGDVNKGLFFEVLPKVIDTISHLFSDSEYDSISFTAVTGKTRKTADMRLKGYNIFAKRLFGRFHLVAEDQYTSIIPIPTIFKNRAQIKPAFKTIEDLKKLEKAKENKTSDTGGNDILYSPSIMEKSLESESLESASNHIEKSFPFLGMEINNGPVKVSEQDGIFKTDTREALISFTDNMLDLSSPLPLEFAPQFISWFAKNDKIKEGIKKAGSRETLANLIADQSSVKSGEYYDLWREFSGDLKKSEISAELVREARDVINRARVESREGVKSTTPFNQELHDKLKDKFKKLYPTISLEETVRPEFKYRKGVLNQRENRLKLREALADYFNRDTDLQQLEEYQSTQRDYDFAEAETYVTPIVHLNNIDQGRLSDLYVVPEHIESDEAYLKINEYLEEVYDNYDRAIGRTSNYRGNLIGHMSSGSGLIYAPNPKTSNALIGNTVGDIFIVSHFAPASLREGIELLNSAEENGVPVVIAVPEYQSSQLERLGFEMITSIPQYFAGEYVTKNVLINGNITTEDIQTLYDHMTNTYNQEGEYGQIVGQADTLAMSVMLDSLNQSQDTLPHEYAHHYIAWFRDSPLVKLAIQKWGSEEALVQSIGEQVVARKGEAWTWFQKFSNWLKKVFSQFDSDSLKTLSDYLSNALIEARDLETGRTKMSPERQTELADKLAAPGIELSDFEAETIQDVFNRHPEVRELFRGRPRLFKSYIQSIYPDSKAIGLKVIENSLSDVVKFRDNIGGNYAVVNIENPVHNPIDTEANLSGARISGLINSGNFDGYISSDYSEFAVLNSEDTSEIFHQLGTPEDIDRATEFLNSLAEGHTQNQIINQETAKGNAEYRRDLQIAIEMFKEGYEYEEIWRMTGFEPSADGYWKKVIKPFKMTMSLKSVLETLKYIKVFEDQDINRELRKLTRDEMIDLELEGIKEEVGFIGSFALPLAESRADRKINKGEIPYERVTMPLKDILDSEAIKLFPELASITITSDEGIGTFYAEGSRSLNIDMDEMKSAVLSDMQEREVEITPETFNFELSKLLASSLYHEFQHIIQKEEGNIVGSGPSIMGLVNKYLEYNYGSVPVSLNDVSANAKNLADDILRDIGDSIYNYKDMEFYTVPDPEDPKVQYVKSDRLGRMSYLVRTEKDGDAARALKSFEEAYSNREFVNELKELYREGIFRYIHYDLERYYNNLAEAEARYVGDMIEAIYDSFSKEDIKGIESKILNFDSVGVRTYKDHSITSYEKDHRELLTRVGNDLIYEADNMKPVEGLEERARTMRAFSQYFGETASDFFSAASFSRFDLSRREMPSEIIADEFLKDPNNDDIDMPMSYLKNKCR